MPKNNFKKYLINLLSIISIIIFFITVQTYSKKIGLFDKYEILVQGNKFVLKDDIKSCIQSYLLPNYFSINLEEIKTSINTLEFVELTQLSLIFPNKLIINIIEREPIALITLENQNYFIDKDAILLSAEKKSINYFPVPIVNVKNPINYDKDSTIEIANIFQILLSDYQLFYNQLSEVIIDENKLTFYSDSKTKIFASSKNLSDQINILKAFESTVYPKRKLEDYSYIDLRIPEQIIVKEKNIKG